VSGLATTSVSGPRARGSTDSVTVAVRSDSVYPSIHDDPLVSVIVPCYNGATFLEEAIRSALAQSYPQVEIIVVDDGSTDNSSEIAQRFPVRYIAQPNSGLSHARNVGIRESKGSYLVFLDADDRLKPEAIETGLRALELRPDCALTVGDHVFISADGSHLADSCKVNPLRCHYEALLKSNFIEMISSVLFRRSTFDEVGGFNALLRVAEDYELYLRIARVRPICCHPRIIAEYRMHETNTSRNSELMLTTTLQVLKSQAKYICKDPGRLLAFREGVRSWRKQYGRQLAWELARSFSTLGVDHLRRKLLLLAAYYPQGLLLIMALRIMPALGQRDPIACSRRQAEARSRFDLLLPRQVVGKLIALQEDTLRNKVPVSRPRETVSS
jgi:glycosyltransferase involved in cell wall biosynthesis